mmetsp:Transcript_2288/g.6059  ORF Transcript_2288/g.6059 Transcript_2288/m.6059 type:complete len:102 (-) Transcript_2288:128-433(-)
MDQAERQKGSVGDLSDAKDRVEIFALDLFQKADTEFRTGVATKNTLVKFRAASIIMVNSFELIGLLSNVCNLAGGTQTVRRDGRGHCSKIQICQSMVGSYL